MHPTAAVIFAANRTDNKYAYVTIRTVGGVQLVFVFRRHFFTCLTIHCQTKYEIIIIDRIDNISFLPVNIMQFALEHT